MGKPNLTVLPGGKNNHTEALKRALGLAEAWLEYFPYKAAEERAAQVAQDSLQQWDILRGYASKLDEYRRIRGAPAGNASSWAQGHWQKSLEVAQRVEQARKTHLADERLHDTAEALANTAFAKFKQAVIEIAGIPEEWRSTALLDVTDDFGTTLIAYGQFDGNPHARRQEDYANLCQLASTGELRTLRRPDKLPR